MSPLSNPEANPTAGLDESVPMKEPRESSLGQNLIHRTQISVCIATFNGERFIDEQLQSILMQLPKGGEVVIVDDASTDRTVAIISGYADARIRLYRHDNNLGYVAAFARAIALARGDVIFLSDQDDVWVKGRIERMLSALGDGMVLASTAGLLPDGRLMRQPITGRDWAASEWTARRPFMATAALILGTSMYYGCAMALRREFRDVVLPFPAFVKESHDQWIALCAIRTRSLRVLDTVTVLRRIHDSNASAPAPRSLVKIAKSRWMAFRMLVTSQARSKAWRRDRKRRSGIHPVADDLLR
jgi:glycosyltransferase involved in cell wall biosynthesis